MAKMHELTVREVENAKPGVLQDGRGLMLNVTKTGAKSWILRYQLNGKRRDMGLGSVGLKEARTAAADARRLIAQGIDPLDDRRAAKQVAKPLPTFSDIAKLFIADAQAKSVSTKCRWQIEHNLGPAHCGPLLDLPINEISALDVSKVLGAVWNKKPGLARKLHSALTRVFDRARVELRDQHGVEMTINPANWTDLKARGFAAPAELTRGHHPSLPYDQMAAFTSDLRAHDLTSAKAMEFLILANVRTANAIEAQWDQIDLDQSVWTVPLTSLKDRAHRSEGFRIPLSPRAVEIVREMETGRVSHYVFPGMGGAGPLNPTTMLMLLGRMGWRDKAGRPITTHGFRAAFRTWAGEAVAFPHDVIETAMGHKAAGKVERAYKRSDLLEKRRPLMLAWANHCAPAENVTQFPKRA
jgi:integrase